MNYRILKNNQTNMAIKNSDYRPDRLKLISGEISIEDFKKKWADKLHPYYVTDQDYEILKKSPFSPQESYLLSKLEGANQSINLNKLMSKEVGADSEEFKSLFKNENFYKTTKGQIDEDGNQEEEFELSDNAFISFAKNLLKFSDSLYNQKLESLKEEMLLEFDNRFDVDSLKEEMKSSFETMLSEKSPTLMKQNSIETNFVNWLNRYINQTYYQNKPFRELISNEISKDPKFLDNFLESSKDFLKLELKNNPNLELTPDFISSALDNNIGNISIPFATKQLIRRELPSLDKEFDASKYDEKTFELKQTMQPMQTEVEPQNAQQFQGQQQFTNYQQPQPQQIQQPAPQPQLSHQQPETYIAPNNYQLESPISSNLLEDLVKL